jgi:adenosine deaminase
MNINELIDALPKAELHVHLFGTLTPELFFEIAKRNNISIPYVSPSQLRTDFIFKDLPSFIQMYDLGVSVFKTEQDFYDITYEYLKKSAAQNVKYIELIYDPQSHAPFNVSFQTLIKGIETAIDAAEKDFDIKAKLILCIVRHLPINQSISDMFMDVLNYSSKTIAIGLGGIEKAFPPYLFKDLYANAKYNIGLRTTAHCGEEGDWTYIERGLDALQLERIDHGINCDQNLQLMERLKKEQIPMTICPVSNVKIGLFNNLKDHNVKRLLEYGLNVSLHSDDPSYFDCYLSDTYKQTAAALDLSPAQIVILAKNSFKGAFLNDRDKAKYYEQVLDVFLSFYKKDLVNA